MKGAHMKHLLRKEKKICKFVEGKLIGKIRMRFCL